MNKNLTFVEKIKEVASYALIIAVGLGIGLSVKAGWELYNTPPEFIQTNTDSHFTDTDKKVIIYSTQWCPYCKKAKEYLHSNNIDFLERDIETSNKNVTDLYQSIGLPGVPKIIVGNVIINGFIPPLLAKELTKHQLL